MATIRLDRIDSLLRQINADAETTARTFRHIADTVQNIQTAQLNRLPELLRASANEAMRLDRELNRIITTQRLQAPGAMGRAIPILPVPTQPVGIDPDVAAAQKAAQEEIAKRGQELSRIFMLQGRSADEAAKFLKKYGFELSDIKRVMIDPITGTRTFTAELRHSEGVVSRATFAFDRFGNAVGDSGTRFRGFTDMISRNIVKVLEWAVAVGVVYGAIAQLRQVVDTLIDINEVMSDITITTQATGEQLNRFFENAVTISRATGVSVRDVLSVYDDALRATASIADQQERAAVSTNLLNDAMLLSRLTGKDAASAMDSLIGALKQVAAGQRGVTGDTMTTAEAFAQGEVVLGTWILAAREGKISLDDLAETFAITGAAASAAGLDVAELTALTTVLAENTVKSAAEIGNSIRRMITTIQSESGIGALRRVGIAVEDLNGQMRDWDEIMRDIAERRRAGALTDAAFRQLTYSLGGGPRGAADVAAVIETWDQVIQKTELFSDKQAAMEARQAAAAAKSQTLKNAMNELNASFVDLVNTLGTEGGLLNTLTTVFDVLGTLIEGVQEFTELLGPATTRLIALGAAMAVLQKYGPALAMGLGGARQGGVGMVGGIMGIVPGAPQRRLMGPLTPVQQVTQRLATPQMAVAAGFALSQLGTEGTMQERGVRVGTTIAGAIIGALTPAGPLIGAAIGDAAGNAFLNFMKTNRLRTGEVIEFDPEELMSAWESTYKDLQQRLSPAGLLAGLIEPEKAATRAEEFMKAYREKGRAAAAEFAEAIPTLGPKAQEEYIDYLDEVGTRLLELEQRQQAVGQATKDQIESVGLLKDARSEEIAAINAQIESLGIAAKIQDTVLQGIQKWAAGEITKKEFTDLKASGEEFLAIGGTVYEVFKDIMDIPIEDFADRFIKMTPEIREEFQGLATDAAQLEEAILVAPPERAKSLSRELRNVQEEMRVLFEMQTAWDAAEAFQFKGFVDVDATEEEFNQLLVRAVELMESYAEQLGIEPEDILGATEDWVAHFEDIFKNIEDVPKEFFNLAKKEADDLKKSVDDAFNLQRLRDLSPSQIPELEQRVNYWRTFLSRIPGYEAQAKEQEFNLVIGEENVFRRMVTTQEALRFAIQDLTEVEKKQLEGMWNIPAGATVMVPLQSLYYAPKGAGAGGVPNLPPFAGGAGLEGISAEFDQPANKMDTASDKMLTAAERMEQIPMTMLPTIPAEPIEMTYDPQLEMQRMAREQMKAAEDALYVMWQQGIEKLPEGGFGPERAGPTMWEEAIKAWPEGGFGPMAEAPIEAQVDGRQLAMEMSANFQPDLQVEVPPIDATITVNIPSIMLNGTAVSEALRIEESRRLDSAARTRGVGGGGVIQ